MGASARILQPWQEHAPRRGFPIAMVVGKPHGSVLLVVVVQSLDGVLKSARALRLLLRSVQLFESKHGKS